MISDKGRTIYLTPRLFNDCNIPINTCWNDLAGLITIKEKNLYDDASQFEDIIMETLNNQVALDSDRFKELTDNIVDKFNSLYILNIN
jgi:hypothetical protein